MFEAMLGALYLDQGMEPVTKILEQVLTPAIKAPKSETLIDYKIPSAGSGAGWIRARRCVMSCSAWKGRAIIPEFEMAVLLDDIVLGTGKGNSKKRAEQMAAKAAFDKMAR